MKEVDMIRAKAERLSPERLAEEIARLVRAIEHPDTQPRERVKHERRVAIYRGELEIRETVARQADVDRDWFPLDPCQKAH